MGRALGCAVISTLTLAGCWGSEEPAPKTYSIEQFVDTVNIRGGRFSWDDQRVLFSSDESGSFAAYSVEIASGEVRRLTPASSDDILALAWLPGGKMLYASSLKEGEPSHLFLRSQDGKVHDLIEGKERWAEFHSWARDRRSFFYSSGEGVSPEYAIYEMDATTFESRLLLENQKRFSVGPISDDRRFIALLQLHSEVDSDIYLFDRDQGLLKHLTPHDGNIYYGPVDFEAGAHDLYFLTDEGSEFNYLMRYDAHTGLSGRVEEAERDILFANTSRTGKYRVIGVNHDVGTQLRVYRDGWNRRVELSGMPVGEISDVVFSEGETKMLFRLSGSRSPSDLYLYDLESLQLHKLTDSLHSQIDPEDLVAGRIVRFPSFDGLEIPAAYFEPKGIAAEAKVPALIWAPGGPGSQFRLRFSPLIQYLVNHGVAVLAVNHRGSFGYGKTYQGLDDSRHGRDDLADCVAAKGFLAATGRVEVDRIGIIGGSYGGFMVLAALAFRPEEFAVGIDISGISNWVRTLEEIPPLPPAWRDILYKEIGHPVKDAEYLKEISPLFHAHNIIRPLLVIQGASDPRVSKTDTDALVEAVRHNGVAVDYVVFDDEEHRINSKKNQVSMYKSILKFLEVNLKE